MSKEGAELAAEVDALLDAAEAPVLAPKPKQVQHRIKPRKYAKGNAQRNYEALLGSVIKLRFQDHLPLEAIGKILDIEITAIRRMIQPFKAMLDNPDAVKNFKKNEPEIMDGIRMLMVQGMETILNDPKRIAKMDLSRLTYGFGIMYDKARLERGESTANVKTLSDLVRAAHATPVAEEAEIVNGNDDRRLPDNSTDPDPLP